jgi:predicted flap endonuclease-1-like 5' DNA nuclease
LETPPPPDDLTVILGIGPKTARVLKTAGIASFSQLARTEVERLQSILGEAGYRLAEPDSWPEQARLAAAGDREALEKFQDELRQRRQG